MDDALLYSIAAPAQRMLRSGNLQPSELVDPMTGGGQSRSPEICRMIMGPVFAMLALVGVVAIFVWVVQLLIRLVRLARGYERSRATRLSTGRNPVDILDERFASGEIDTQEFQEKRNALLGYRIGTVRADADGHASNAGDPPNVSWLFKGRSPLGRRQA